MLSTIPAFITETTCISATIYLDFDKDWKTILSAYDLEIETDSLEIETRPPIRHDDDGDPPTEEDLIAGIENMPQILPPPDRKGFGKGVRS